MRTRFGSGAKCFFGLCLCIKNFMESIRGICYIRSGNYYELIQLSIIDDSEAHRETREKIWKLPVQQLATETLIPLKWSLLFGSPEGDWNGKYPIYIAWLLCTRIAVNFCSI